MRDFTIREAADEAASNFPGIPRAVTRHICQAVMDNILDIIAEKKGRIRLQLADIHTIYYDIVPDEQRAKLADLDESRVLTEEEEALFIIQRNSEKPNLSRKNKRLHRRHKRAHYERFTPATVYPK